MFKAVGSILGRTVAHKAQDKLQAPLWFPVPSALPPQQFHNQQKLQALFDIMKNNNNTAQISIILSIHLSYWFPKPSTAILKLFHNVLRQSKAKGYYDQATNTI